jgi:hypothetical protein
MGHKKRCIGINWNLKNKKMLKEDNEGFVRFPNTNRQITKLDCGKSMVYIVAFDVKDVMGQKYVLSNLQLEMPGTFVSDDVNRRPVASKQFTIDDIDELIDQQSKDDEYDSLYFPNLMGTDVMNKVLSIPMTTVICVGWSDCSYELRNEIGFWNATFDDLTNEGKKLYYSIRKLHNNKEIRILTFNNI